MLNSRCFVKILFCIFAMFLISLIFLLSSCNNENNTLGESIETDASDTKAENDFFDEVLEYYQSRDYEKEMSEIQKTSYDELPQIEMNGDIDSLVKGVRKTVQITYKSQNINFECYADVNIQGNSSSYNDKKSYNIRLFDDEALTEKHNVKFFNSWGSENKYCLKSNYVDATISRNIVTARLWGQVLRTRETTEKKLLNLVNCGAIDGFTVMLTVNGKGPMLYTLNIPRDEWLFKMGDCDTEAIIAGNNYTGATKLSDLMDLDNSEQGWRVLYSGNGETDWIEESFNRLVGCVQNSNGNILPDNLSDYTDIDACVDYLVFIYMTTASDNRSKNVVWITYDGVKWLPSVYDLDATWGMEWNGLRFQLPTLLDPDFPEDGTVNSGTGSTFWDNILNTYPERVIDRYCQLKATVFKRENIELEFTRFLSTVPEEAVTLDRQIFKNIPGRKKTNYEQLINHYDYMVELFDEHFDKIGNMLTGHGLDYYDIYTIKQ